MMGDYSVAENHDNGCTTLSSLDTTGWDTSKIEIMERMFSGCESLTKVDLSKFDTSNVTDMDGMFSGCKKLQFTRIL